MPVTLVIQEERIFNHEGWVQQEQRQMPKCPRLPNSVYVQSVETVKQSGGVAA